MALTQEQLNRILGNQSVVQRAFAENRPTVTNTPRSIVSGTYADLLQPATNNIVGDILLGDIQRGLNSASYNQPLTTGSSVQTGGFRPEYLALALGLTPMGKGKKAAQGFSELASSGKIVQAKNKAQEIDDLVKGKSKFAEVTLNWDDPKSYDLADKLEKQGFMSTVIDQGRDQVTLFHKKPEDISSIVNAKTPYDYGKAYGYSEADVANFYKQRYGKEAEKYFEQDRKFTPKKTTFEVAQETAQRNASLPISEGGLGLPATNTAKQRAEAMGNIPVYHGGNSDIRVPSYEHSGKGYDQYGSSALYTATSPYAAGSYVKPLNMNTGENAGGNIMPLMVNPKNFLNADEIKALTPKQIEHIINKSTDEYALSNFGDVDYEGKAKVMKNAINSYRNIGEGNVLDQLNMLNNDFYQKNPEAFNKAAMEATGYKGVWKDMGSNQKFLMPWEISNIRSRFAAFDPFRRNEADILAGVGVGIPTGGLLDEKKKK